MLGYYNYTIWLTCLGMASAVTGITFSLEGEPTIAVAYLMLAGFCDCVDGIVARTKKDRTAEERHFGIQLDSLCDIVSFGVFPAVLCYSLGVRGMIGTGILIFYCFCAVIRLAWFNMLEECRGAEKDKKRYYHGLPVTFMSAILPLVYFLRLWTSGTVFVTALGAMLFITGIFYIIDFPLPKTHPAVAGGLMLIDIIALLICVSAGI